MNRRDWFIALGAALVVAAFLGPLASSAPDGLEWASARLSIIGPAPGDTPARAPLPDYSIPFVGHGSVSTALSGMVGTLVVAAALTAIGYLLRRRSAQASLRRKR